MFKKLNKFLQSKIKVQIANTTAICCSRCGSIRVKHYESKITKGPEVTVEEYYIQCQDCGAYGMITETWKN